MIFSLYQICIIYWLSCITISYILGVLTIRKVAKSETLLGLVYFGKFRNGHNFRTWLRTIEVPKRWFWIFYFIALIAVLFGFIDVIINGQLHYYNSNFLHISIGLLLYLTHIIRRLYECIYVSIFSDSNMNILHFLLGCTFYPFCVCSQLSSLTLNKKAEISVLFLLFYTILVVIIFAVQFQQHYCFVILAELRRRNGLNVNSTYKAPIGGLFEYCLSPHYFLEIIFYFLFALFYHFSIPILLCFLFVTVNQTIAALLNQSWYLKHFPEYSSKRKALIPYIL